MLSVISLGARLCRTLAAVIALIATTSWVAPASAAQDGTIFDDRVFEWRYYLDPDVNPDLQSAGLITEAQARWHWQTFGVREGRRGGPGFHSMQYLALQPDVRNAFGTANYAGAINHYLASGYNEGRHTQYGCTANYDLSSYGLKVPGYCFAKKLNATITSREQFFTGYIFCFPLPANGRIVNGLTGEVSLETDTVLDSPSEAQYIVGYTSAPCPANGTQYLYGAPRPNPEGNRLLASFIAKRQGSGAVTINTNVDFPAVAMRGGNLYIWFDGGASLNIESPIRSIKMTSNVVLKTTQAPSAMADMLIIGTDEYCYNMNRGCEKFSPYRETTFVTVWRAMDNGTQLRLFGNVSAGSITRPTGVWTAAHDWIVTPCTNVPEMPSNVDKFQFERRIRPTIDPGTPRYGFTQWSNAGDNLHWNVNTLLPLTRPINKGTDCIVHLTYANVNSQMDIESQVNFVMSKPK